jgi:hypothetical protein
MIILEPFVLLLWATRQHVLYAELHCENCTQEGTLSLAVYVRGSPLGHELLERSRVTWCRNRGIKLLKTSFFPQHQCPVTPTSWHWNSLGHAMLCNHKKCKGMKFNYCNWPINCYKKLSHAWSVMVESKTCSSYFTWRNLKMIISWYGCKCYRFSGTCRDYKHFCSVSPYLLPEMQTYGIITSAMVLWVFELVVNVPHN